MNFNFNIYKKCFVFVFLVVGDLIGQGSNFYSLSKIYRGYWNVPGGSNFISYETPFTSPGLISQGLQYYVLERNSSAFPSSEINEYFREWSGVGDHMTDYPPSGSGYMHGFNLGRVFHAPSMTINGVNISPNPLKTINRYRREWWINGNYYIDHATSAPIYGLPGYTLEGPFGYGFERYGWDRAGIPPIDITIKDNAGLTVGMTKTWGGAISQLRTDFEYVNRFDAGRLLQMATNLEPFSERYNPTEGGDGNNNGSPLIQFSKPSSSEYSSTTMPLMWRDPATFTVAHPNYPLLYGGTFNKSIRAMDYNPYVTSKVLRMDLRFTPHETATWGSIVIPALYLNSAMMVPGGGQHSYYRKGQNGKYGLVGSIARNITTTPDTSSPFYSPNAWSVVQNEAQGASMLIIAHGLGTNRAIGVLARNVPSNASFVSAEYFFGGTDHSATSSNCHAIYFTLNNVAIPAGTNYNYRVWILIGTKTQILADANAFPY